MALTLNNNPTYGAENTLDSNNKRITSLHNQIITIGALGASAQLAVGYPMGFNQSTNKHTPWVKPTPSVTVLTLNSRTGGTWGITINGVGVANTVIAWNATAAVVKAELRGLGYDATVVLDTKVYTITWNGTPEIQDALPTVVIDLTAFTGGSADATQVTTAGTLTNGADRIRGFINPEVAQIGVTAGTGAAVVLTGTDTLCTITTTTPHGFPTGATFTATTSGATETKLNLTDVTITIIDQFRFSYPVAAVSGGTTDTIAYTTTNDVIATMMTKGDIHYDDIAALIAAGSITALQTALKDNLMPDGLIIQGLVAVH